MSTDWGVFTCPIRRTHHVADSKLHTSSSRLISVWEKRHHNNQSPYHKANTRSINVPRYSILRMKKLKCVRRISRSEDSLQDTRLSMAATFKKEDSQIGKLWPRRIKISLNPPIGTTRDHGARTLLQSSFIDLLRRRIQSTLLLISTWVTRIH